LEPDGDRLRVRIATDRGSVRFFLVQYEAWIEDRHYPVARYDASHGTGHQDLLDRNGDNVGKKWFPKLAFQDVVTLAHTDFKANWRRYRSEFIRREGFEQ